MGLLLKDEDKIVDFDLMEKLMELIITVVVEIVVVEFHKVLVLVVLLHQKLGVRRAFLQ